MSRTALAVTVLVPLALFGGAALQTTAAQQAKADPLAELLVEVRELRVAMERLASATPRVQLLTSRLTMQEERVNRATRDLESIRSQLENFKAVVQALGQQAKRLEEELAGEADPRQRTSLERRKQEIGAEIEAVAAREQALRAREAETIATVGLEQARWQELSGRLDDLERALEGRR